MRASIEVLVPEFGEVDDNESLHTEGEAIARYTKLLETYPGGPAGGSVSIRNIGKGADWPVVVLLITGAFFAIPNAHKKVRESLEEWKRIYRELRSLFTWVLGKKRVLHSDQYLFLVAVLTVADRVPPEPLVYLGLTRLPEGNPDLADKGTLLFSFSSGEAIHQVAVARDGEVSWADDIALGSSPDDILQ